MFGLGKKHNKKTQHSSDLVIIDEKVVSVSELHSKFKWASTKFWCLLICIVLISSMIMPYMSNAAGAAATDSEIFNGEVVPGYSMGGITVAAYGVDLNEWAKPKNENDGTIVRTNYGIWNENTVDNSNANAYLNLADSNLNDVSDNGENQLDESERSYGWAQLTGRTNYSLSHPEGQTPSSNPNNNSDNVAPYRTIADYNFWDSKSPTSSNNASANIDVTLYADFIIVSKDEQGNLSLISNPDSVTVSDGTGKSSNNTDILYSITGTTAQPYYISLKDILNVYGLNEPQASSDKAATIDNLLSKISDDGGSALASIVNEDHNLLNGTDYQPLNSNAQETTGQNESEAFNPYPYTMVFTGSDNNGNKVISSIYENCEAYVFFSPASAYQQYTNLRTELDNIINANTEDGLKDPALIFKLGYYSAEMAILESYLEEALPQDATRGYVGPTETTATFNSEPGKLERSITDMTGSNGESASDFHGILYGTLMYDVSKKLGLNNSTLANINLGKTNALMDLLSTFGYNTSMQTTTGVMKGGDRNYVYSRANSLTPYSETPTEIASDSTQASAGIYTPVYYPIQQHCLPESEKAYRFQVLSSFPYETLISLISSSNNGKSGLFNGVSLTYASGALDGISISDTLTATGDLAQQFSTMDEQDVGPSLSDYDASKSIICNPETSAVNNQESDGENNTENETLDNDNAQTRVDSALLNYNSGTMTSDNVHDLVDIVRATCGLKEETWNRYYNPRKGAGGDNDIFVTRVAPAQTSYMPSILFNGYTPAGGSNITQTPYSKAYDYFAIPSFAPCFASHTASDTYYGALSYEVRAFYESAFLETLSSSVNLPAIQDYNEKKEAQDEYLEGVQESLEITKADIMLGYVLAKRLAIADTWNYFANASEEFSISGSEIGNFLSNNGKKNIDYDYFMNKSSDTNSYVGPENEGSTDSVFNDVKSSISSGDTLTIVQGDKDDVNTAFVLTRDGLTALNNWLNGSTDTEALSGDNLSVEATNAGIQPSDQLVGRWFPADRDGNGWTKYYVPIKNSNGNEARISVDLIASIVYNRYYNQYLSENGEYYWVPDEDIWKWYSEGTSYNSTKVDTSELLTVNDQPVTLTINDAEEQYKYEVHISGMDFWADNDTAADDDLVKSYKAGLEACYEQITKGVTAAQKDLQQMISSMPSQMQNCVAWADYKDATDSEGQYQSDPTDSNVIINLGQSGNSTSEDNDGYVTNLSDLEQAGWNWDAEAGKATFTGNMSQSDEYNSSMQARMVRGVEGSTSTATITPSCYTISATVARVSQLSANAGTTYPYYGIANGRLESGADRYAQLQAHKVDYTSIASGMSDLNTNRVTPQLVSVTQPEYGTLPDFLDILGNIGAFLSEAGASMLAASSEAFSTLFFDDNNNQSSSNSSQNQSQAGILYGNDIVSSSTIVRAYTNDDATMNRISADSGSFNISTQSMQYDNSMSSANAATMIEGWASNFLINEGYSIYSLIQSFGLVLVMLFLLIVAFRNFYAYTVSKEDNIVTAQTQLKVVLPRSIIALFMIGLPPVGDSSIGFQGGCYLLLQLLGSVIDFITNMFLGLNGTGIMSMWTSIDISQLSGGITGIAAYILFFLACLVMSVMFILGMIAVFIQSLMLAAFYFVGPIVWAFYVWPFSSTGDAENSKANAGGLLGELTTRMSMGPLTNKKVGNEAPAGWIVGYITTAFMTVMWALLFWIVSVTFLGTSGVLSSSAEAQAANMNYAHAASTAGATTLFNDPLANVAFATFICVIIFLLMLKMAANLFQDNAMNMFAVARNVGKGVKDGVRKIGANTFDRQMDKFADKRYHDKIVEAARRGDEDRVKKLREKRDNLANIRERANGEEGGLYKRAKAIASNPADRIQTAITSKTENIGSGSDKNTQRATDERKAMLANRMQHEYADQSNALGDQIESMNYDKDRYGTIIEHLGTLGELDNKERAEYYDSLGAADKQLLGTLGISPMNLSNVAITSAINQANNKREELSNSIAQMEGNKKALDSKRDEALSEIKNLKGIDNAEQLAETSKNITDRLYEQRNVGRIGSANIKTLTERQRREAEDLSKNHHLSKDIAESVIAKQAAIGSAFASIGVPSNARSLAQLSLLASREASTLGQMYQNDFKAARLNGTETQALSEFINNECNGYGNIISTSEYAALSGKLGLSDEEQAKVDAYEKKQDEVIAAQQRMSEGKATEADVELIRQNEKVKSAERMLGLGSALPAYNATHAVYRKMNSYKQLFDDDANNLLETARDGSKAARTISSASERDPEMTKAFVQAIAASTGIESVNATSDQKVLAVRLNQAVNNGNNIGDVQNIIASTARHSNDPVILSLAQESQYVSQGALPSGVMSEALKAAALSSTLNNINGEELANKVTRADEMSMGQSMRQASENNPMLVLIANKDESIASNADMMMQRMKDQGYTSDEAQSLASTIVSNPDMLKNFGNLQNMSNGAIADMAKKVTSSKNDELRECQIKIDQYNEENKKLMAEAHNWNDSSINVDALSAALTDKHSDGTQFTTELNDRLTSLSSDIEKARKESNNTAAIKKQAEYDEAVRQKNAIEQMFNNKSGIVSETKRRDTRREEISNQREHYQKVQDVLSYIKTTPSSTAQHSIGAKTRQALNSAQARPQSVGSAPRNNGNNRQRN